MEHQSHVGQALGLRRAPRPPLALFLLLPITAFAASLTVLPPSVSLDGPESYQQLLAETSQENHQEDWTRTAQWTSSNPGIAKVDQTGMVRPAGDGEATITVPAQGRSAPVIVHVKNAHEAHTWSFRNDVIPVMSKVGCNSGACHGNRKSTRLNS